MLVKAKEGSREAQEHDKEKHHYINGCGRPIVVDVDIHRGIRGQARANRWREHEANYGHGRHSHCKQGIAIKHKAWRRHTILS